MKFRSEYVQITPPIPFLNLNENLVNMLLTQAKARDIRVAMVQCLTEKVLSPDRTYQLVSMVNSYFMTANKDK